MGSNCSATLSQSYIACGKKNTLDSVASFILIKIVVQVFTDSIHISLEKNLSNY